MINRYFKDNTDNDKMIDLNRWTGTYKCQP